MATGTFLTMDKTRPGAYINYRAPEKPRALGDNRGYMTVALPMSWGPEGEIITLTQEDMASGASLRKVGFTASQEGSLPFRLALSSAHTAYLFRLDAGGSAAAVTLGNLSCTARYPGTAGNRISVQVAEVDTLYAVTTFMDKLEVDRQVVANIDALAPNAYVTFAKADTAASLSAAVATPLSGGTDGTVTETTAYAAYLAALGAVSFTTLACISQNPATKAVIADFIRALREDRGIKVQGCLYDYASADYEGIISTNQGYKTASETVGASLLPVLIASLTAGAGVTESLTYYELADAVSILDSTGEVHELSDAQITADLVQGKMLLSRRYDRKIVIEQDINTLHTFSIERPRAFAKNRVLRVLDEINHYIVTTFEGSFIGKVGNTEVGRATLRAAIVKYAKELSDAGAIEDFDSGDDVTVLPGETKTAVIVHFAVHPVDSLEQLYMTVYVG